MSPDGKFAVSSCEDGVVKVWDLNLRTCIAECKGHNEEVNYYKVILIINDYINFYCEGVEL